jgi:dTDP-4-amino-4,6-dideoxygalactose transaminase
MRRRGYETTVGTYGLHLQPFYSGMLGVTPDELPHSTRAAGQSLTLPLFPEMDHADIDGVVAALVDVLEEVS